MLILTSVFAFKQDMMWKCKVASQGFSLVQSSDWSVWMLHMELPIHTEASLRRSAFKLPV